MEESLPAKSLCAVYLGCAILAPVCPVQSLLACIFSVLSWHQQFAGKMKKVPGKWPYCRINLLCNKVTTTQGKIGPLLITSSADTFLQIAFNLHPVDLANVGRGCGKLGLPQDGWSRSLMNEMANLMLHRTATGYEMRNDLASVGHHQLRGHHALGTGALPETAGIRATGWQHLWYTPEDSKAAIKTQDTNDNWSTPFTNGVMQRIRHQLHRWVMILATSRRHRPINFSVSRKCFVMMDLLYFTMVEPQKIAQCRQVVVQRNCVGIN